MASSGKGIRRYRGLGKTVVLCILLCFILGSALFFYTRELRKAFQKEIIEALGEISQQSAIAIQTEVEGKFDLLEEISLTYHRMPEPDELDAAMKNLDRMAGQYGFKRMGLIYPNGYGFGSDGARMDLGGRSYFREALNGNNSVSSALTDIVGGDGINVYAVPVRGKTGVEGVLFATFENEVFRASLTTTTFQGRGYAYIVDQNGDAVMASVHPDSVSEFRNIYDALERLAPQSGEARRELMDLVGQRKCGYVQFLREEEKYMYCCPIQDTSWSLLMVVPLSAANQKMDLVIRLTSALTVLLVLIFSVLILYILKSAARQRRELMRIAYVDPVTGGATYAKFRQEAQRRLKEKKSPSALLNLDLESFQTFNDLFGYGEGNRLLRYLSQRLQELTGDGALCARRSADHFVALCFYGERRELEGRLERFCQEVKSFVATGGGRFTAVPIVGIYEVRDANAGIDSMLDCADIARKSIKGVRSAFFAYFDNALRERMKREKELEDRMEAALVRGEFRAYYQPRCRTKDSRISGAEALVRWIGEDGSMTMPGDFVPLAERNGFITTLDRMMFREVCRQQAQWQAQGLGVVPVSVNLSKRHLYNPDFIRDYIGILREYHLDPSLVQLEITESVAFDNTQMLQEMIEAFHREGIGILMDDFGSGYSSMALFRNLDIDVVKLDKSFADHIGEEKGERVLSTMIQLSHSLGVPVTAEGVETEEQFLFLKREGCDDVQGFYFARPMSAEDFRRMLLEEEKRDPSSNDAKATCPICGFML